MILSLSLLTPLSLALRLLFVLGTLRANPPARVWAVNADAFSYRHLAHNLFAHGRYARDEEGSRYTALLRPPVYPAVLAVLAALEWAGGLPGSALWAQAAVGALIPAGAAWLAWAIYQKRWAMWLAGLLAALSPTGIAISAVVLPDLLFAALFMAGFIVMILAATRPAKMPAAGRLGAISGLLFGIAALTKPALTFWPVALVPVWWLCSGAAGRRVRWGGLIACILVQSVFMLGWCARNYAAEGVFTLSAIPAQNLRNMIVPRMEVWRTLGRKPSVAEVGRHYVRVGLRTKAFLHDPEHSIKEPPDA